MTAAEILQQVLTVYRAGIEKNAGIRAAKRKLGVVGVPPDYSDALALAENSGKILGKALADALMAEYAGAPVPEADALAIVPPALRQNHEFVAEYVRQLQTFKNRKAGLPPVAPDMPFDEERAEGIAVNLSRRESLALTEDIASFVDEVETNSLMDIDDAVAEMAEIHEEMGLSPKIVRTAASGGCCPWCDNLEGSYDYSAGMDRDVFRRHENCRCLIEYEPARTSPGRARRASDASPKKIERRIRTEQDILSGWRR